MHNNHNYNSFFHFPSHVAGTPEDKMRLFLIYYISTQQAPSEVCPLALLRGRVLICSCQLVQNRNEGSFIF